VRRDDHDLVADLERNAHGVEEEGETREIRRRGLGGALSHQARRRVRAAGTDPSHWPSCAIITGNVYFT